MNIPACLLLLLLCVCPTFACADELAAIVPLTAAANAFLDSLSQEQAEQAQFPFAEDERTDWHYVPKSRKGLPWAAMTPSQQELSWGLFAAALSERGGETVLGVIAGEHVLWLASDRSEYRNPKNYYVTIFGQPADGATWGVRLEGHHLSINLTVIDGQQLFVTPSFFGANPDEVRVGKQTGSRPLAGEQDQAIQLLGMLDEAQLAQAVIAEKSLKEIITRADRQVEALALEGLPVAAMTAAQQDQLMLLIEEYVGRYREPFAQDDLQQIRAAGIENIHFVWAGARQRGRAMYYRVQGPTFIIEYVNSQNGANHSHTVWRDLKNDFGYDQLKHHLESGHTH